MKSVNISIFICINLSVVLQDVLNAVLVDVLIGTYSLILLLS